jgi:putative transcriptional regulator
VEIRWRLRMAAAQREVWTGAQLRRLLGERAGLHLSSASVSALLTRQPAQVKLETLAALCTSRDCTPGDLIEVDTTPVPQQAPRPGAGQGRAEGRPGAVAAAAVRPYPPCGRCGAPVKFRDRDLCHACCRRAAREALRRTCPGCGRLRHLRPAGTCAICDRPAVPRPAKTVTCAQCGEQRPNAGHGLCNRCKLADPDWPFPTERPWPPGFRTSPAGGRN